MRSSIVLGIVLTDLVAAACSQNGAPTRAEGADRLVKYELFTG